MSQSQPIDKIIGHFRALAVDLPNVPDTALLSRYISNRDADAFAALVRRHGPMVRGVCRRILRHEHDAEDAFQATFLVLVRKATSVKPKFVGNWLYGVAYQTAVRARAIAAKRRGHETNCAELPEPLAADNHELSDILPLLDKKLNGLPDKYRVPIVLCDLEGKTRKQAADQLGWPEGTVAGRLARGRAILARRLGKMVGSFAVALSAEASACVPLPLVEATLRAASLYAAGTATTVISAPVVALTQGVLKTMLMTKVKTVSALVLFVAVGTFGTGRYLFGTQAVDPQVGDRNNAPQVKPELPPGNLLVPDLPTARTEPPSLEQLRAKYVKLQDDLSKHLTAVQLKQRADELEKELASAIDRQRRLDREKKAAAELEKARLILAKVASEYSGTDAGNRSTQALQVILARPETSPTGLPALPPIDNGTFPKK